MKLNSTLKNHESNNSQYGLGWDWFLCIDEVVGMPTQIHEHIGHRIQQIRQLPNSNLPFKTEFFSHLDV
jgi:hypothetical protein